MSFQALNFSGPEDMQYDLRSDDGGFSSILDDQAMHYPDPEMVGLVPSGITLATYYHQGQPSRWVSCSPPAYASSFDGQRPPAVNFQHPESHERSLTHSGADLCDFSSASSNPDLFRTMNPTSASTFVAQKGTSHQEKRLEQRRVIDMKKKTNPEYRPKLGRPYKLEQTEERKKINARRRAHYHRCKEASSKR